MSAEQTNPVLTVNGTEHALTEAELNMNLLDYIREVLNLTGTKNGCGTGACGSCTVLIDDAARRSCLTKVSSVVGKGITTIEGFEQPDGSLHPIQQAFIDAGAIQCGFCTPGMVLSAYSLLLKNKHPDREEIRKGINTNLCRCTGYQQIVDAVEQASKTMYP